MAFTLRATKGSPLTHDELDANFSSGSQPLDATLTAIAGLTNTANDIIYFTATDTVAAASTTAAGRALIGLTGAADKLGYFTSSSAAATTDFTSTARSLLDDASISAMRVTLDVPSNAEAILDTLIDAKGDIIVGTAADTPARVAIGTNGYRLIADSAQTPGVSWVPAAIDPGGRVTLTTAVPVTTSDVTAATTVYYTPYKHNIIELYDGSGWLPTAFTELSQTTSDSTKSPAAVTTNSNYDIFVWNDSGTIRATRGPLWSSATTRGTGAGTTELELLNGRYVNKVSITNGPAAQRGRYVGTIRSDGSSQINDSVLLRRVWNMHNRVLRVLRVLEATNTWTYTTATIRQVNGSAANQVDLVRGLDEETVSVSAHHAASNTNQAIQIMTGVGLDITTASVAGSILGLGTSPDATRVGLCHAFWKGYPGLGYHFLAWLEYSQAVGTTSWYGDNNTPTITQTGMQAEILA